MKRIEFHSHTSLSSDGSWSPLEMIRSARKLGQHAIALTDHVSISNVESSLEAVRREIELAREWPDIIVLAGVEITHVPARHLAKVAKMARAAGAEIILVHGETLAEPVEPGTNRAAVECEEIDILAHPGLLTVEEAEIARSNNIFLELTARRGHSLTNGHIAALAMKTGAQLVVDTDAHSPSDLIDVPMAINIALGAGLVQAEAEKAAYGNAEVLLNRIINQSQME